MSSRALVAIAACLFLPACLLLPAATGEGFRWRIEAVGELTRPNDPESASMGGIAWVSNGTYLAVTDWNPAVWQLEMPADPSDGKLKGCTIRRHCRPAGAVDVEAIALDPLDGSIWLADERTCSVKRFDLATGRETGIVALPPMFGDIYRDSGFESLTISADGLTMWTCTEEALRCDGARATHSAGTDVRLVRLARTAAKEPWKVSGEWVYRTDCIAGGAWPGGGGRDLSRCGVAELCVLDDGALLVLEREFSKVIIPRLRCRIYEADLSSATDVQGLSSISNAPSLKRAEKRMLYETSGFSMYEGMCLGPRLRDGSRMLVLVSDGDKRTFRSVLSLRLHQLPTSR